MTIKDDGYIYGNTAIAREKLNLIGFDIEGKWIPACNALAKLKSTAIVIDCGAYRECPTYRKIFLWSTKTESELDTWLCNSKTASGYVGTFEGSESDIENYSDYVE